MSSFGPISCAHGLLPGPLRFESILLSPVLHRLVEKGLALRTLKLRANISLLLS